MAVVIKNRGTNQVILSTIPAVASGGGTVTIGPVGSGATIILPAPFPTAVDPIAAAAGLGMADVVDVILNADGVSTHPLALEVTKANGPPFLITITNNDAANNSPTLNAAIIYNSSVVR